MDGARKFTFSLDEVRDAEKAASDKVPVVGFDSGVVAKACTDLLQVCCNMGDTTIAFLALSTTVGYVCHHWANPGNEQDVLDKVVQMAKKYISTHRGQEKFGYGKIS